MMDLVRTLKEKLDQADIWEKDLVIIRNGYLKVKGSRDTNLYYVESGSLRIFFEDDYEEQVIRLGYPGNFIVALDSFISEEPSNLYIQAIKKSKIKLIKKATYLSFINSSPENLALWNKMLEALIYQQLEREKDILTYSPQKRYERVLARSPQLFQEIPSKHIASYLRMSPETLSRLKKH